MPYVFALLVVFNAGLLGYFIFVHDSNDQSTVIQVENEFTNKIDFQDTSEHVPPLIGKK